MNRKYLLLLLAAGLAGCGAGSTGTSSSESPGPTTTPSPSASASATPSPDASATPTTSPNPTASLKDLPATLTTDGYRYFGLSNTKPVDLVMTQTTGKNTVTTTGAVETKLVSIDKDSATFEMTYTGDLARSLGSNEVKLLKDGVHVTTSSVGKLTGDTLEVPNSMTPGTTWTTHTIVQAPSGDSVEQNIKFKVVGPRKVDTKGGSYPDALLVTGSGTMKIGKNTLTLSARGWYVKDRGPVRTEFSTTGPGSPPGSVTIQERKAS